MGEWFEGFARPSLDKARETVMNAPGAVWGSMTSNPDVWMKSAGIASAAAGLPGLAPVFNAMGTGAEGVMQKSRLAEYQKALEAEEAMKAAGKRPTEYSQEPWGGAEIPKPQLTPEQKSVLARGAPRKQTDITMSGAQAASDAIAYQREKSRQAQAQMKQPLADSKQFQQAPAAGVLQAQRNPFAPPGMRAQQGTPQQPSLAMLAQQLVRRRPGGVFEPRA